MKRAGIFMIMLLYFTILFGKNICMASENTEKEQADDNAIEEFYYQKIMDETDFGDIEKVSKEYVPDKMTFTGLVHDIAQQKEERPWEIIGRYIYDIFFFEVENVKPQVVSVLIYTVMFAVLSKLIFWEKNYVYNVSFLLVYASIMVLLISTFDIMGDLVSDGIDVLLAYLTALVPAYATVLAVSGNGFSAAGFYIFTFTLIYIMEWLIKLVFLPGIHIFLLLQVMNNLYEEEKISKLADIIESAISKALKLGIKIVAGIGIVQAMIAPAKDRISDSLILKSFQAIPGIGRVSGSAGEIMLGCAMLIKNSVGAAALIVLLFIVLTPLVKTFVFSAMYKVLSAFLQPLSDKRITDGINGVARAAVLYYCVMRDSAILFFIVIAIVCASTSFIH